MSIRAMDNNSETPAAKALAITAVIAGLETQVMALQGIICATKTVGVVPIETGQTLGKAIGQPMKGATAHETHTVGTWIGKKD